MKLDKDDLFDLVSEVIISGSLSMVEGKKSFNLNDEVIVTPLDKYKLLVITKEPYQSTKLNNPILYAMATIRIDELEAFSLPKRFTGSKGAIDLKQFLELSTDRQITIPDKNLFELKEGYDDDEDNEDEDYEGGIEPRYSDN